MGPVSAPQEIADRSKIVLLSIDGHFDPRKMPSGRGFGKNMKIEWKIDAKIEGFWWLRTTFGVILFAYFTLLPFSKNTKKTMQKWMPKVVIFGSKTDLGRPRVDWFYPLWSFLMIRKIIDFLMSLWVVKKSIKIGPRTALEGLCCESRIVGARLGSPGAAFSRAVSRIL